MALLHSVSYFFFLSRSPSSSLCMVFDSISSNADKVLSVNVFFSGEFNIHHNEWLTYSGETDRPLESQLILPRWLTFLFGSPIVTPDLDLFISSDASICSTMAFPPSGNSDHVVVSVYLDFPTNTKLDA